MIRQVGLRELRHDPRQYAELARGGDRVEITDRGHVIAVIGPPDAEAQMVEDLLAAGDLIPAENPVDLASWAPMESWPAGEPSPSETLAAMREAEAR